MNISRGRTPFAAIVVSLAALACCGCAGQTTETAYNPPAHPVVPTISTPNSDIVGVYQGTTRAYCLHVTPGRCNAVQEVTITLTEDADSKIRGSYRCAYGNKVCYHLNETGKVVDASINGARLSARVMMPDGSSCLFSGFNNEGNINGGYSCYQGGSLIEQGIWRAKKEY
jgi:hypothetical protein